MTLGGLRCFRVRFLDQTPDQDRLYSEDALQSLSNYAALEHAFNVRSASQVQEDANVTPVPGEDALSAASSNVTAAAHKAESRTALWTVGADG